MTKDDILKEFHDINFFYNDCCKYDTLSQMLDELIEESSSGNSTRAVVNVDDIEDLPPVISQQKTGHWISGHEEIGALGITYTEETCSKCGWSHSLIIPKNYCPKCGAKMVESQESEVEECR